MDNSNPPSGNVQPKSKLAILSFILSLLFWAFAALTSPLQLISINSNSSSFTLPDYLSPLISFILLLASLLIGIVALIRIRKYQLGGSGFAVAGIIIALIPVALSLFLILLVGLTQIKI